MRAFKAKDAVPRDVMTSPDGELWFTRDCVVVTTSRRIWVIADEIGGPVIRCKADLTEPARLEMRTPVIVVANWEGMEVK